MGMNIGSAGAAGMSPSSSVNNWQQRQQNFAALSSALQSGDLGAAQKAYSSITGNNGSANSNSNSPMAQIGKALQAGDLQGAQQAMQTMQSRHHHHHEGQSSGSAGVSSNTPASSSSTSGGVINTTA